MVTSARSSTSTHESRSSRSCDWFSGQPSSSAVRGDAVMAEQLADYLENGNILNAVNFPNVS
ncbi:MAG: hypothetical protein K0M73_06715, partial [Hydrogenophaga sp.]|nr:hypothetical protein [Hydrogenophaga sp.]